MADTETGPNASSKELEIQNGIQNLRASWTRFIGQSPELPSEIHRLQYLLENAVTQCKRFTNQLDRCATYSLEHTLGNHLNRFVQGYDVETHYICRQCRFGGPDTLGILATKPKSDEQRAYCHRQNFVSNVSVRNSIGTSVTFIDYTLASCVITSPIANLRRTSGKWQI